MLKNPTSIKAILRWQNLAAISRQFSTTSLLDVCAGKYHITLVD
jgi:hypothetical protein